MAQRNIVVTGGAGYIGSHTVRWLEKQGCSVTVVDNLSRGYRHNVRPDRLRVLDVADTDAVEALLRQTQCEAVIHFAAFIAVGESMQFPELHFANNAAGSLSLLTAMLRAGVRRLVFSSTAAVYGIPDGSPIPETAPIRAVSPYGESKVMVETMLRWFDRIHGLRAVCLRYFNAAGADPAGGLGEEHNPETHLIPLVLRAVLTGEPLTVFGGDYQTPDGTAIRDYIHVNDLAQAHLRAVEYLLAGGASEGFNVGTGRGHSVMEVIGAVERATGRKVPYVIGPRREGDPPALVADAARLQTTLGWKPEYVELERIVETAWRFSSRNRD